MDEAVFTRTAKAYKDRLFAIAFHYCRSRADAEDILQTVLLKYYRSEKEFGTEEYLREHKQIFLQMRNMIRAGPLLYRFKMGLQIFIINILGGL